MSLAELAAQSTTDLPWRTCVVCHALDTIPPAEAEGLRTLLRGTMRYAEISQRIAKDPDTPLQIDRQSLSRHARGQCSAREMLRPLKRS